MDNATFPESFAATGARVSLLALLALLAVTAACTAQTPPCADDRCPELASSSAAVDAVCTADVASDPQNCGACGTICQSGMCLAGVCADQRAGHVVVIGSDYATSTPAADALLGNALLLPPKQTVRLLVYRGGTSLAGMSPITAAIKRGIAHRGRGFQRVTTALSSYLAPNLASFDTLLILPQPQATDDQLAGLADEWLLPISDFVRAGGTVVVLDAVGDNHGTPQVLGATGWFAGIGRTTAGATTAQVALPGDAVTLGLPLVFATSAAIGYDVPAVAAAVTADGVGAIVVHETIE